MTAGQTNAPAHSLFLELFKLQYKTTAALGHHRGASAAFAPKWSSEAVASGQRGGDRRHPAIGIRVVPKPRGPHRAVHSLSSPALPVLHCPWAAQVTSVTGWMLRSCAAPHLMMPWSSVVAQIHYTETSPAASLGQS